MEIASIQRHFAKEIARTLSKPVVMFHGTDKVHLRSILKHGLSTKHMKKGVWLDADHKASEGHRSMQSYGGIYTTGNLMTAISSATNYKPRTGTIIVCMMINPQSMLPDEDNYDVAIPTHNTILTFALAAARLGLTQNESYKEFIKYRDILLQKYSPSKRFDDKQLKGLAGEVILAAMERRLSHTSMRSGTKQYYSAEHNLRDALRYLIPGFKYTDPIPKKLRPVDKLTGERKFRNALDRFIKKTKTSHREALSNGSLKSFTNVRSLTDITYRGRNRIICVLEIQYENGNYGLVKQIVIHYGKPPQEFLKDYAERVGTLPNIVHAKDVK